MQLCQSEWTVLQSLWERQPQTLMQLVEDLKLRAGWSASTSKTMAARMTEKGLLRYEGKPRRYYPNVTREEAGLEETEQLLSRAFADGVIPTGNSMTELTVTVRLTGEARYPFQFLSARDG